MSKSRKPRHTANPQAFMVALMGVRLLSKPDQQKRTDALNAAVQNAITGQDLRNAWCVIADALNVTEMLLKMPSVAKGGSDYIKKANALVGSILDRYADKDTTSLYPHEVRALHELSELWQELLSVVTNAELFKAEEQVVKRVMQDKNARDVVVMKVSEVL